MVVMMSSLRCVGECEGSGSGEEDGGTRHCSSRARCGNEMAVLRHRALGSGDAPSRSSFAFSRSPALLASRSSCGWLWPQTQTPDAHTHTRHTTIHIHIHEFRSIQVTDGH